jgi:hypothetical protein
VRGKRKTPAFDCEGELLAWSQTRRLASEVTTPALKAELLRRVLEVHRASQVVHRLASATVAELELELKRRRRSTEGSSS